MKDILLSILLLMMAALSIVSIGCDTGRNRTITGDYFNRNAGDLKQAVARVDSLKNYPSDFNSMANCLAGKYGDASAFTVIKFSRLSATTLANLDSARLKVAVSGVWSGGVREFGLYPAGVNWTDSTQLDPSVYLTGLGTPLAVSVDSTETISSIIFTLNSAGIDYLKSWNNSTESTGAFLIKNTDRGNSMMNIYSYYSNYQPVLQYFSHTAQGVTDTSSVNAIDTAYAFSTGISTSGAKNRGIISDGAATGFTLYFSLPDSFATTNAVNSGKLVIPIEKNQIPADGSMYIGAYMLTSAFSTLRSAETSDLYYSELTLTPTDTKIEVDLTGMLGAWTAKPGSRFGILFKPTTSSSSPAQISLLVPDSIGMMYTTIPEVE